MAVITRIGDSSRGHRFAAFACVAILIAGTSVNAVRGAGHHKSLTRLKAGLQSVRDGEAEAQSRIADLNKREKVLNAKLKNAIVPKTIPGMLPSLEAVRQAVSDLEGTKKKALHRELTNLFENGHAQALSLLVGTNQDEAGRLSVSEVKKGLLAFDSKKEVLRAIDKVMAANREPNSKTALLATVELKKIQFERKALQKKLRKLERDEETITAELDVVKGDSSDSSEIDFQRPIPGKVTSGFGTRVHPIDHVEKGHKGIDLAGEVGDPVKSAADGKVIFAGEQRGYGKIVIVQHSTTFSTAYAHLSDIKVSVGEEVEKGEKIGEVGMTGNSTGPHLHFEIRENGDQVDPAKYL